MQKIARNALYILMSIIISINIVLIRTKSEEEHKVKVPILLYHNIVQSMDNGNVLVNITPENFRAHMTALKNAGYEGITLDDYYNYVNSGKTLAKKPIIISFDDGYLSNYEYAFPILKELNMKAVIFIVTSSVGANNTINPHFTWSQAKEMQDSGIIDIQSHSHTHPDISFLDANNIVRELRLSKYLIEVNLNKQCDYLAYPYGMYNEQTLSIASTAGYKMQCKLGNSGYNTKNTPPTMLKRITVWGNQSAEELVSLVEENLQSEEQFE